MDKLLVANEHSSFGRELVRTKEGSPSCLPMMLALLSAFCALAVARTLHLSPLMMLIVASFTGGVIVITASVLMATKLIVFERAVVARSMVKETVIERDWIRNVSSTVRNVFRQGGHHSDTYRLRIDYLMGSVAVFEFEWCVMAYESSDDSLTLLSVLNSRHATRR